MDIPEVGNQEEREMTRNLQSWLKRLKPEDYEKQSDNATATDEDTHQIEEIKKGIGARPWSESIDNDRASLSEKLRFSLHQDWSVRVLSEKSQGILRGILLDFARLQMMDKVHGYINTYHIRVSSLTIVDHTSWTGMLIPSELSPPAGQTPFDDITDLYSLFQEFRTAAVDGGEALEDLNSLINDLACPRDIQNMFSIYVHPSTMSISKKMDLIFGAFELSKGYELNSECSKTALCRLLLCNSKAMIGAPIHQTWVKTLQTLPAGSIYAQSWSRLKADLLRGDAGKDSINKMGPNEKNWLHPWHILIYIRGTLDHQRLLPERRYEVMRDLYVLFPTIYQALVNRNTINSAITLMATEDTPLYQLVERYAENGNLTKKYPWSM